MKTEQIKENLIKNNQLLIKALEDYGFANIKIYDEKELRCGYSDESNSTSVVINLNNLYCTIWSKNIRGDIYSILSWKSGQDFKQVHKYLNSLFGNEIDTVKTNKRKLFGGAFQKYINSNYENDVDYSEEEIKSYSKRPNQMFIDDGIKIETQQLFDIRYDFESHYIIIPWKDECDIIRGVRGRRNFDDDTKPKYMTFKKFKKNNFLFGLNKTMSYILQKRSVIIYESEKSVMKSWQYEHKNCVAVGSHCLSEQQIRLLKYNVDNICIAYDKDVEEDVILDECKKIKRILPDVNVYYMLDNNNILDEKESPVDKDLRTFNELLKNIKQYRGDEDE